MSVCHSQALINASPSRVWDLIGDPRRHPEWWPRVIEVRGEQFDEGSDYAQVTRDRTGQVETFWIFDATLGRPYFRRWLEQSLAALDEVAAQPDRTA